VVTFASDAERFTVFFADSRVGVCMALEDAFWFYERMNWN
jgi:hypothetical protein